MEWPAQSPDLNPIENLWHHLDSQAQKRLTKPQNLDGLFVFGALREEWENINKT
ncbi:unnamed protein product [Choristocarpus tenellus]